MTAATGQAPAEGAPADPVVAERITVTGVVQGVGFRPFVFRLATELGLRGRVGNDSSSVFIEVVGPPADLDRFVQRLQDEAPALARIGSVERVCSTVESAPPSGFQIVESRVGSGARTLISPDVAVCQECRRELFDPRDRRHRHPFITCTNCGPRFTIITGVPYDRPNTTMAGFDLCHRCRAEYEDPTDRRYHAQPIGCHDCGPTLSLRPATASLIGDPIESAAKALQSGEIVAVKGLGGYHLVCDGGNESAVAELRARKHRPDKPFAVMAPDLEHVALLAEVSPSEARLLESPAAPIVLLRAKPGDRLAPSVAPGNPLVGVMLPYTPVHHLLLDRCRRPLVMTSANIGGTPIAYTRAGIDELDALYDLVLDHDRPIHVPCDDSVVRVVGRRLMPIRRARGYAPIPVSLPPPSAGSRPSVLAVGGELKNTFCISDGDHAWVGQHIGDLENLETIEAFERTLNGFLTMYDVTPEAVAADLHPGYRSSGWARANHADAVTGVQHHHAHVASVLAEHGIDPATTVLGFAFDGTGYGTDGAIWGGELLAADGHRFERLAHLAPIPLPGGDAAIQNPNRVALAHLHAAALPWSGGLAPLEAMSPGEPELLRRQLDRQVACVPTTSMGRLFDAVASLIALRHRISYEAQAAIELEITAARHPDREAGYRFAIDGPLVQPKPVLEAVLDDLTAGLGPEMIAMRFHQAVADVVLRLAVRHRSEADDDLVALTGGVFQNALLTELCLDRLEGDGFTVLTHRLVPPNDGGLALGQAFVVSNSIQQEL